MDKITISNMKFFAYHGVLQEEQDKGQYFLIDIDLFMDLKASGNSDRLADTIDYSEAFTVVRRITENNTFRLIEKLADSISREILSKFERISGTAVRVRKPDAPIIGEFDWVGVEIVRHRDEL